MSASSLTKVGSPKDSISSVSSNSLNTLSSDRELSFCFKGQAFNFVGESLKNLEAYVCAICQEISSDPYQTACGHLFCSECIHKVGEPETLSACPTCRGDDCHPRPDEFTKKMIKGLMVKCPAAKRGCDWQGPLGDVFYHSPKKCSYRAVLCEHCGHASSAEEPTTSHLMTCLEVPLNCPSNCGGTFQRKRLPEHISECPEMLVPCKYAKIGCEQVVARKDLENHLKDKEHYHQAISLDKTVQLSEAYTSLCSILQDKGIRLPTTLESAMSKPWLSPTTQPRLFPPVVFKVDNVAKLLSLDEEWISDDFCSHLGGYVLYMMVHVNGRTEFAKGKYISVYIGLKTDINASLVTWPFLGTFTYTLLNQLEDRNHCTRSLTVDRSLNWAPRTDRELYPRGYHVFISHKNLRYQPDKNCQYLKNDTLFFRVDKVELAST